MLVLPVLGTYLILLTIFLVCNLQFFWVMFTGISVVILSHLSSIFLTLACIHLGNQFLFSFGMNFWTNCIWKIYIIFFVVKWFRSEYFLCRTLDKLKSSSAEAQVQIGRLTEDLAQAKVGLVMLFHTITGILWAPWLASFYVLLNNWDTKTSLIGQLWCVIK